MADDALTAILANRVPETLAELRPYLPDLTKVPIRLDANEAPSLLPALTESERRVLADAMLGVEPARYPDARATPLRDQVAKALRVAGEQLVFGVGSDEVIAILLSTLARPLGSAAPTILTPKPTFVMYRASARVRGFHVVEVPLDASWDLDEAAMLAAMREHRPALIFLATPNNPTAGAFARARVERIVEEAARLDPPAVVVVDEAYLPYRLGERDPWNGATGIDLLAKHSHVVVLRTLSKVGLAALRVGWAVAHPSLAWEMEKVRQPYNLPSVSIAAAACMLSELAPAIARHVAGVQAERQRVLAALAQLPGIEPGRTDANFFWVRLHQHPARQIAASLKEQGILVRDFAPIPQQLRISVGAPHENDALLSALTPLLAS